MKSHSYKEKAPPGQNAPQGKIYHRHMERETVKSKQALGPLTVLQGAPFSSILHAGACLKPLLLLSAWPAWLCCPGPSGSTVSPSHKHTNSPRNANPSATMTLPLSLSFSLSQA